MIATTVKFMPAEDARAEVLARLADISCWLGCLDVNRFASGHDPVDCGYDTDALRQRVSGINPLAYFEDGDL